MIFKVCPVLTNYTIGKEWLALIWGAEAGKEHLDRLHPLVNIFHRLQGPYVSHKCIPWISAMGIPGHRASDALDSI